MANRRTTLASITHHTVTPRDTTTMVGLRAIFRQRFGVNYVGYNLVIFGDGHIESDIGEDGVGIHNNHGQFHNYNAVGVAVTGDFTQYSPTKMQTEAVRATLIRLRNRYVYDFKTRTLTHREMWPTACPSNTLYDFVRDLRSQGTTQPHFPQTVTVMVPRLNVRKEPHSRPQTSTGAINFVKQPTASGYLEVEMKFQACGYVYGENVGGNNLWVKSCRGNYVFSGGTNFKL